MQYALTHRPDRQSHSMWGRSDMYMYMYIVNTDINFSLKYMYSWDTALTDNLENHRAICLACSLTFLLDTLPDTPICHRKNGQISAI